MSSLLAHFAMASEVPLLHVLLVVFMSRFVLDTMAIAEALHLNGVDQNMI